MNYKIKKPKKHASYLKIYIKTADYKLNLISIPLWLTKEILIFILKISKFVNRFNENTNVDIEEILRQTKTIIKELRKHPPFSIVEIKTKDTNILIRTK